jgi:hypothetical protein
MVYQYLSVMSGKSVLINDIIRAMGSRGDGSSQPTQASDRANMEDIFRPGEDYLRGAIDVTPALIHTGLPDSYLNFLNQPWLKQAGVSMGELRGWAWTVVSTADLLALIILYVLASGLRKAELAA